MASARTMKPSYVKAKCERWNRHNPPGTMVLVRHSGEVLETETESEAFVSGTAAVVRLRNLSGLFPLAEVDTFRRRW